VLPSNKREEEQRQPDSSQFGSKQKDGTCRGEGTKNTRVSGLPGQRAQYIQEKRTDGRGAWDRVKNQETYAEGACGQNPLLSGWGKEHEAVREEGLP